MRSDKLLLFQEKINLEYFKWYFSDNYVVMLSAAKLSAVQLDYMQWGAIAKIEKQIFQKLFQIFLFWDLWL